ncbi:MAG: sugar phosphate isomerase/epimerase [Planctomycetes bacterium]|nr:sugar phosphate isomerase/epimerase [Planctomycetota bacterium]MBL7042298.1 sugar phosphate isomerase/epimerase [Pirellulaceae bacterium]
MTTITRRRFVQSAAAMALAAPLTGRLARAAETKMHVACNHFCWINMYRRQSKDFNADLDAGLAEVKRSGMDGLEAMLGDAASAERIVALLKKHGLEMRSFYTGATLHDPAATDASIERVVATAAKAKELIDLQIVVVNPTPLRGQAKSDAQLATQAKGMTQLGGRLAECGMTLAYHFHAPAWQNEGREFHHVMTETDPKLVKLCLDTHWVYRGSGNNAARVYEVVKRYGKRVAELHLRQSKDGVWTECLTDGDIDHVKVADGLKAQGVKPLIVLEQAVEKGTPNTMDAVESHRRSRTYVEKVFARLS